MVEKEMIVKIFYACLGWFFLVFAVQTFLFIYDEIFVKDDYVADPANVNTYTPISIAIDELLSSYKENEVAADVKFQGKQIRTSGIVSSIEKDHLKNLYVELRTTQDAQNQFGWVRPCLQAFFAHKYTDDLASLKKKQTLEVVCKIQGSDHDVIGKECTIVK